MNLKLVLSLLVFSLLFNRLIAQELHSKTIWEGKLFHLRLIMRLSEDSLSKQKTAVFDSPDQNALGIKISELKITKDSLSAYSSDITGGFAGAFNPDKTEILGKWKQGGQEFPFSFKQVTEPSTYKRPQMPIGPFPYLEEKVVYHNKNKSIQYGATLTLPKSDKNVPVVILITGSGQEDRDETLFGHKPFWVIADYLSRNGIAVLRVDDRGIGETTGDVISATSLDFAKDVLVGIDFLKTHKGIDLKKIGLIGHSEGGVIAPLVANESKDVAFIVSLAGVGVKGSELMAKQFEMGYIKAGFNKEEVARMETLTDLMVRMSAEDRTKERNDAFRSSITEWLKNQPDTLLVKAGFKGEDADKRIEAMASRFFLPWMRYFIKYDPANTLTKIKIPVLALNGGKDVQVSAKENLAGFDSLLKQASNKNYKTIMFPNLNHLFQSAVTGETNEYASIDETISPEVLSTITKWINTL